MFETNSLTITLLNEDYTLKFGQLLSQILKPGTIIFLEGELGVGKTTLVRGFLRGLSFDGAVKSPTYTLVEEYAYDWGLVYHFDLYRMNSPEELEFMGIREYFRKDAIVFVEWAERGVGFLPAPDIEIIFRIEGDHRVISVISKSDDGLQILSMLKSNIEKLI